MDNNWIEGDVKSKNKKGLFRKTIKPGKVNFLNTDVHVNSSFTYIQDNYNDNDIFGLVEDGLMKKKRSICSCFRFRRRHDDMIYDEEFSANL
jgi:hypothetical protein